MYGWAFNMLGRGLFEYGILGMKAPMPSLIYSIISSVSAWPSGSAEDPRPSSQCEDTRHSGHLCQLVLLLRRTGMLLLLYCTLFKFGHL